MTYPKNPLDKFLTAQEVTYPTALAEIKNGCKKSHWMWYIFPQIKGLGFSRITLYYAIENLEEAKDYLSHEILGNRLREITKFLLNLKESDPLKIMGTPDDLKLKSCMTLFHFTDGSEDNIFKDVINQYFKGEFDNKTLEKLNDI
jgi:uncharacterized protein (DUF1810 family)